MCYLYISKDNFWKIFSVSQLLSRGTVGFHSGELSDIVSLFLLDCKFPATGGTVVGVLLDDVQKKSVIFGNNNLPAN